MIGSPIFRLYFSWLSQSQIIFRKFPFFQDLSETSHLFMVLYDKCLQFVILVFNFKNSCFQVFFRIACEWSIFLGVFSLKFFKKIFITLMNALRETCNYSELFWSAFSRIRTEYGEIRSISKSFLSWVINYIYSYLNLIYEITATYFRAMQNHTDVQLIMINFYHVYCDE